MLVEKGASAALLWKEIPSAITKATDYSASA
jgi:hypothetical protein